MRDAIFWIAEVRSNVCWIGIFSLRMTMYFGDAFFGQKYFRHMLFESGRFVETKRRLGTWSFLRREFSPS